jgi:acyl dehydratase
VTGLTSTQRFFEDAAPGSELGPLVRTPSDLQLLEYAGASRDYNLIHHDRDSARAAGLPDVIVQGSLKSAFLSQLITEWIGSQGSLRALSVQYRGLDIPGTPLAARGVVTKKYERSGVGVVECDLWLESGAGRNTTGHAVVVLPMRRRD